MYSSCVASKFLADKEGLDVRVVMSSGYYPSRELIPGYQNEHLTVEKWVGAIQNAKYVVTNSFHGTVFSLIMNKRFISMPLPDFKSSNDRIVSLLEKVGLLNHLTEKFDESVLNEEVNWNEVRDKLDMYREKSFEFIDENILK